MLHDFDSATTIPAAPQRREGAWLVRPVTSARNGDKTLFEKTEWCSHFLAGPDSIRRISDKTAEDGWTTLYIPQPLTRYVTAAHTDRLRLAYRSIRPLPPFCWSEKTESGEKLRFKRDLGVKFVHLMSDHDCTRRAFELADGIIIERERNDRLMITDKMSDPEADRADQEIIDRFEKRYQHWPDGDIHIEREKMIKADDRMLTRAAAIEEVIKSRKKPDDEREKEMTALALRISRFLKRHSRQRFELLALALKLVGADAGLYVSDYSSVRMMNARAKQRAWSEVHQIRTANGGVFRLSDIQDKAKRREAARIYRMNRDLERFAREECGFIPCFLTLTAPPRFHTNPGKGKNSWDGSTPAQSQKWLAEEWAKLRARLAKRDITLAGFRVPEGHKDACTHFHPLVYVHPCHREALEEEISYRWQIVEDDDEGIGNFIGRQQAIANVRWLDDDVKDGKKKASAASYVMTYVLKTLNSKPEDEDRERSCRQVWGIRGYQFFGVTTKRVWEALRHEDAVCSESADYETSLAIQYAKSGDFYSLLKMDGEIGIKNKDRIFSVEISDDDKDSEKRIVIISKKKIRILEFFKLKAVLEAASYSYLAITQEDQSQNPKTEFPKGFGIGWVVISDKTGISYIPPP